VLGATVPFWAGDVCAFTQHGLEIAAAHTAHNNQHRSNLLRSERPKGKIDMAESEPCERDSAS
jgi:hypothetical protein